MTLSIKAKHFLTLMAISALIVIGMYIFMQWSFNRGFRNHVNTEELNNMNRIAEDLTDYYRQVGSWSDLRANRTLWQSLQRKAGPGGPPGRNPDGAPNANDPLHIGPRTALVAADRQTLVVGGLARDIRDLNLRPLVLDGETIGYLGLAKHALLADSGDQLYIEQQSRAFALIALIMILVSMALGIPLLNHLLVPVKEMTKGAEALANGNYATRIPVLSRDELGRLTQVFNLLAATLEKNEAARRRCMADLSHELRTPLAILSGEIEALRDGVRTPNQQTLTALYGEVQRINRLLGDLHDLAMSDIGGLGYRKHPLDPVVLLEQALDLFTPRMAAAGITMAAQLPAEGSLVLNADAHRFQQLLTNLLENSLRYTDPNGRIELLMKDGGGELQLVLQDSSPGVTVEQFPKLFEPLYRGEASRSRARGGSGLGLAICRNIVEAHQGRIEALASPLGGVRIEIRLPLA